MPIAAPRPCSQVGCRALAVTGGRCTDHEREAWRKKVTPTKRITGRKLQEIRAALFADNPFCAICGALPRSFKEWQRDHIIPLAEGGADDAENEQGLCQPCHEVKSKAEALRGVRRSRFS